MKINKIVVYIVFFGLLFTGLNFSQSQKDFKNILNYQFEPDSSRHWAKNLFMDNGAWFGFALPIKKNNEISFNGPFFMNKYRWIAKSFVNTKIFIDDLNIVENAESNENYSLPGKFVNNLKSKDVSVKTELIFINSNTASVRLTIKNNSKQKKNLQIEHSGSLLAKKLNLFNKDSKIYISNSEKDITRLSFVDKNAFSIKTENNSYFAQSNNKIVVNPNSTYQTFYLIEDLEEIENNIELSINKLNNYYLENEKRWNLYIAKALNKKTDWLKKSEYKNLAIKSVMTLVGNMKTKRGDLKYNGIIPSAAVSYFDGFWSWDSWKIAVGYAKFDSKEAENQMYSLFSHQLEDGMVPDVIYKNKAEDNLRDTKPPLASWGTWEVYKESKNKEFLKKLYPKLVKFHYWWYAKRDINKNGLCEYGSTDGTAEAALWESGMDDAVRFDNIKMLKDEKFSDAYSIDLESVDLNAYLYYDKISLAKIAKELKNNEDYKKLTNEAEELKKSINSRFLSNEKGFYFDYCLSTNKLIDAFGPEGWIPLWTGVVNNDFSNNVKNVLMDEKKFNTFIPLPTVSADNPQFMTGYWRGPVWLDQFYFGVAGLYKYGFKKEANVLIEKLFRNAEGLLADSPIQENYDARNGKMLKAPHFSWSASSILLMLREDY